MKNIINEATIRKIVESSLSFLLQENSMDEFLAFQGTSADFDAFDLSFIGSGEGSQQYGYGIYVTDNESTGRYYADLVAFTNIVGKDRVPAKITCERDEVKKVASWLMRIVKRWDKYHEYDVAQMKMRARNAVNKTPGLSKETFDLLMDCPEDKNAYANLLNTFIKRATNDTNRFLLSLDIADGPYLDWDESDENVNAKIYQIWKNKFGDLLPQIKKNMLSNFGEMFEYVRGFKNSRKATAEQNEWQKQLTLALKDLGYIGIKVPIGRQKGINGDGIGKNYVIFDPQSIKIIGKENLKA